MKTLKQLEQRSRELGIENYADILSHMDAARNNYESASAAAAESCQALTSEVSHWTQYQQAADQLLPWLDETEAYIGTKPRKTKDLQDAESLLEHHKVK